MRQHTIRRTVSLDGVGLHSGRRVRITLSPAPAGTGILFRSGPDGGVIPAAPESVADCHYATTLGVDGTRIQTVEHLLAAAAGLAIDNLAIDVEGGEVPAGDGSARPFVALLTAAGRASQSAHRRPLEIPHPIRIGGEDRWIRIVPGDTFRISYTIAHDHPAIGVQARSYEPSERRFVAEVAPARTYGFLDDLGALRRRGLALGGSLDNAIVISKRGPINMLRYPDEFVRHKILDLIGDLALLGRPVLGHVIARNGGHALNLELVVAIQRALGLERHAVGAEAPAAPVRADGLAPAPAAI